MSRIYIYTVTNACNGRLVVTGSAKECAAVIGMSTTAICYAAQMSERTSGYFLEGMYAVTRQFDDHIHPDSKYYEVRLHKTGKLVCAGTSTECANILGLPDVNRFRTMVRNCNTDKVRKWTITSAPYSTVSPDLTPIPPIDNSAREHVNHHKKPSKVKPIRKDALWHSVYLRKTDELICSGTATECAKTLGMKGVTDFNILVHKVRKGTNKKYEIYSEPYYENAEEENL